MISTSYCYPLLAFFFAPFILISRALHGGSLRPLITLLKTFFSLSPSDHCNNSARLGSSKKAVFCAFTIDLRFGFFVFWF